MTVQALDVRRSTVRIDAARAIAVAGLVATAAVHVPVAAEHVGAPTYLLVSFDLLVLTSAALAASLAVRVTRTASAAALLLSVAAVAAYVASRSIGLPLEDDDVGDWGNALGLVALTAQTAVVVATARLLLRRR